MHLAIYLAILLGIATAKPHTGAGIRKSEIQFSSSSSSFKNGELQHEDKDAGFLTKHEDLSKRTNPIVDSQVDQSKYRNPGQFHTQRLQGQEAEQYFDQFVHGQSGFKGFSGLQGSTGSAGGVGSIGSAGGVGQIGSVGSVDQHLATGHEEATDLRTVSQSSLHGTNARPVYNQTPGKYSQHSSYSYSQRYGGYQQTPTTSTILRTPVASEDATMHRSQQSSMSQTQQQNYHQRPGYGATTVVRPVRDSAEEDQYESQTHDEDITSSRVTGNVRPVSSSYGSHSRLNTHSAALPDDSHQRVETVRGGNVHQTKRVESSQSQVRQEYVEPVRTVYTDPMPTTPNREYTYGQRPLNSGNSYRTLHPASSQSHVSGNGEHITTEERHESSSRTEQRSHTKPKVIVTSIPAVSSERQELSSSNLQHEYDRRPLNSGNTFRTLHPMPSQSHVSGGHNGQVTEERRESSRTEQKTITKPAVTTTMHVVRPVSYTSNEQDIQTSATNHDGYYMQRPSYPAYTDQEHVRGIQTSPAFTKTERTESRYVETSSGSNRPTMVQYPTISLDQDQGNFKQMSSSSSAYGTSGTRYTSPIVGSTSSGNYQYASGYAVPTSDLRTYQTYRQPETSYQSQQQYKSSSSHSGHGHTTDMGVDDCDMQGDDPSLLVEHNDEEAKQFEKFGKYGFGQIYDKDDNKRTQRRDGYGHRHGVYPYQNYQPNQQQQYDSNKFVAGEQQYDHMSQQSQHHEYDGYHHHHHHHVPFTYQTHNHGFVRQEHEDLTQQTQDPGFGKQEHEDLTQQTQDHGFGGQEHEDLTQQTQDGFGKLEFGSQHEDLTQQTQDGFGKLEYGAQHEDKIGKLEIGGQEHESITQKQDFSGQEYEDLTQQTQDSVGKLEFGSQHEELTQQKQDKIGKLDFGEQQHEDLTQQTQDAFGKSEFGVQQQIPESAQLEFGGEKRDKLTQQTGDKFGQIDFGSHTHDTDGKLQTDKQLDKTIAATTIRPHYRTTVKSQANKLTPQTQTEKIVLHNVDKQDKLTPLSQHNFGGQHHEDITEQHNFGGQEYEDLTQQTQDEFGKLEFGGQEHEDLTQQTQDGFGKLEFGSQQHEDLTQQQQSQIGKLELARQEQEDLTQQTQDGFGKLEFGGQQNEDFTQQQQDKVGKLEFGAQQQEDSTTQQQLGGQKREDLTQQTQDAFGKFEFAGQQEDDLTQQTQDGFGKIDFGMQQQQEDSTTEETQTEMDSYALRVQQNNRQQQQISGSQGGSPYVVGGGHYASYPNAHLWPTPSQSNGYARDSQVQQVVTPQQTYGAAASQVQPLKPTQTYGSQSSSTTPKKDTSAEDNSSEEKIPKVNKESAESKESEESKESKEEKTTTTTTPKPGFWKRVGGKLKDSYDTVRESTKQLADKVQTSIG